MIDKRKFIWIALAVTMVVSVVLIFTVNVNYDLAKYLPEDSITSKAITKTEETFGYPSMISVMAEDVSIPEALAVKERLASVEGVSGVLWLDDMTDISTPESMISSSLLDSYYKDRCALFTVSFSDGDYSQKTYSAIAAIRELDSSLKLSGSSVGSAHTVEIMGPEMLNIMLIVVPLCVIVLMLASSSWTEPFMLLFVIGVSIVWNMATNAFLPSVSFVTHSMAAVIQLAVAMDYSLFYYHRYNEERANGLDVRAALLVTSRKTFVSIISSAFTTIAGFLALFFMRYEIGSDFGLVLAKGIAFSFIAVQIFMPIIIYTFHGVFERTSHKVFLPSFKGLAKVLIKLRYLLIPLFVVILVPAFLGTQKISFLYGDSAASSQQGLLATDSAAIADKFGRRNPVLLLVPEGDISSEIALADEIAENPYVSSVYSLTTLADPAYPRDILPESVRSQFISGGYVRMIVYINAVNETTESDEVVELIRTSAQKYYPDEWLAAGSATSVADIRDTINVDGIKVTLFSLLFVGVVVLIAFRSALIPVLLLAVIEASVLINMSVAYFAGEKLIYIGYLVVSAIQLGATIDYAILITNRYLEYRPLQSPRDAAISAIGTAGSAATISAMILAIAGFAEGLISKIPSVLEIGTLLGRGALLSLLMVILVLPALLVLFDKAILHTTVGMGAIRAADKARKERMQH